MSGKTINVLLIEGDTDESSLVKRYLSDAEDAADRFVVKEAVRVSSACHELAREDFDVVILDLQVPQNVGLEGFTRIQAQRPEIPIIVLTGLHDEALAAQAVRRGAQDYLVKGTHDCCLLKRAIRYAVVKKKLANLVELYLNKDFEAKLVVDGEAVVLYANPAAEELFGVAASELTGKPFAFPRESGTVTIVSPRAAERTAEMRVNAIDWNGEPARLISFLGGSEAGEARQWKTVADERGRLDDIKSQFTRRLSHEMRNTLSTVKTAVFCLKDPLAGPLSARQARLVDMISRNVDRQVGIFDKIGDLARFEGGKLKFDFRRVEMGAIIDEFARESELKGGPNKLEIEQASTLPPVKGDADLILQVLRSLLDNAFRGAKGKVILSASRDGADGVRVTVADDGEPIAQERLHDLFTPFAELDKRGAAVGFNGGLGLTMSREIITGHNGRIWAETDAAGNRFMFTLPRYVAADSQEASSKKIFVSNSRSRPTYASAKGVAKERS